MTTELTSGDNSVQNSLELMNRNLHILESHRIGLFLFVVAFFCINQHLSVYFREKKTFHGHWLFENLKSWSFSLETDL